jgi:hypothetical protein
MTSSPYIPTFKVVILGSDASGRGKSTESAIRHLQGVHLHSARECDAFSVVVGLERGGYKGRVEEKDSEGRQLHVLLNVYVMTAREQLLPNPVYMGAHAAILYVPEGLGKGVVEGTAGHDTAKELGHVRVCVDAFTAVCPNTPIYLVGTVEDVLGESSGWVDVIRDRLRGHILGVLPDSLEDRCLPLVAACRTLLGDHRLYLDPARPTLGLTPEQAYRIRGAYGNSEGSVKTRYSLELA